MPITVVLGLSAETVHRKAAMASGGLDSLPRSGTVVALFVIMGLKHRDAFRDLGGVTVVVPLVATTITIAFA